MRERERERFRLELPTSKEALQELVARIDVYSESIRATIREGERMRTIEVSPAALAEVFSSRRVGSGLLPRGTLYWGQSDHGEAVVVAIPPELRDLNLVEENGETKSMRIPLPRLVFAGVGREYRVFAVRTRSIGPATRLYHAPLPNVHAEGRICAGEVVLPEASAETIMPAFELFVRSRFNGHLADGKSMRYPESIAKLWAEIDGARRFPGKDLVATGQTLGNFLSTGRENEGETRP